MRQVYNRDWIYSVLSKLILSPRANGLQPAPCHKVLDNKKKTSYCYARFLAAAGPKRSESAKREAKRGNSRTHLPGMPTAKQVPDLDVTLRSNQIDDAIKAHDAEKTKKRIEKRSETVRKTNELMQNRAAEIRGTASKYKTNPIGPLTQRENIEVKRFLRSTVNADDYQFDEAFFERFWRRLMLAAYIRARQANGDKAFATLREIRGAHEAEKQRRATPGTRLISTQLGVLPEVAGLEGQDPEAQDVVIDCTKVEAIDD